MKSLSRVNQADIIEAFNLTSRYLDDLLTIDNIYFDQMVDRIYPTELQLNRANSSDTEAPFWIWIYVFLMVRFPPKFMINGTILIFDIVNFPFLDGDVPRRTSYGDIAIQKREIDYIKLRGSTTGFHLLWHTVELAMSTRLCLL